ncbi:MAG: endonuclease/exonuclease/phosphatase family protein [Acidobacteriia bacterium]|nr:endonuclease/exonuclease/phosphatase family protein [Terriglobia bacterium]
MLFSLKSTATGRSALFLVLATALSSPWSASAANPNTVTVMTRNLDAGTDMNYILAATDQTSFVMGAAATLAEVKASRIPERAARIAEEIAAYKPDLIALQEVTLWRTGPLMQPPATVVLYDQLDLLMAELAKRNLHYAIAAVQSQFDAEAPVPTEGIDLRITDRDVILARIDLPQSQFDVSNAQTHRYQAVFKFGSPVLGEIQVPRGWMAVDVEVQKSKFRLVNTHLESTYPGLPAGETVQQAQVEELLAALASPGMPVILAGDFNANAEPGPEQTGAVRAIRSAHFADSWKSAKLVDPGYTWPLFGEDQASGPASPNERIDLIFTGGDIQLSFWGDPNVVSVERTGTAAPWASDHAGVVVKVRLK